MAALAPISAEAACDQIELDELARAFDALFGRDGTGSHAAMMALLHRISHAMTCELDEIARRHGFGYGDFETLNALRLMPGLPVRPTDLARILRATLAAITARVHRLQMAGLVVRQRSDDDHREVLLSLTPPGISLSDRMMTEVRQHAVFAKALVRVNERSDGRFARDLRDLAAIMKD